MTNDDFVTAIVEESTSLAKKDCESFLNAFTNIIKKSLRDRDEVQLVDFGTFNVKGRAIHEKNLCLKQSQNLKELLTYN